MQSENMRWCLTEQQFRNTPSILEGLTLEKESSYRRQMGMLIQKMGQKLKLSQVCINSAVVYSHRFYTIHSFTRFDRFAVGSSALFLSSKLGDQPKRSEHIVKIAHNCIKPEAPPLDPKATKIKCQELVFHENILLSTLGFDFDVEQVCAHVAQLCGLLKLSKELAKTAYVLAIYSVQLTTMCLRCPPKLEACVCLALAGELAQKGRKDSCDVLPEGWCLKALGPSWKASPEATLLTVQNHMNNFHSILRQYPNIVDKLSPNNGAIKRPLPQNSSRKDNSKKPKNSSSQMKAKIHSSLETKTQFCEADTSIRASETKIPAGKSLLKPQIPPELSISRKPSIFDIDTPTDIAQTLIEDTGAYIKSLDAECNFNNKLITINETSNDSSVITHETNWSEYQRI